MASAVTSVHSPQPDCTVRKGSTSQLSNDTSTKNSASHTCNGQEETVQKPSKESPPSSNGPNGQKKENEKTVKRFDTKNFVEAPLPKTNPWKKSKEVSSPPPTGL